MSTVKLPTQVTRLYCLCAYNCTGKKIIYITSCINEKLVKQGLIVETGLVEPPKGGLVEQQLKNKDECSLPQNMSGN